MAPTPIEVDIAGLTVTICEDDESTAYAARLWDCSVGLSQWMIESLLASSDAQPLKGKCVVELGAGTALCSLALLAVEPEITVIATELEESALPLMRAAAEHMGQRQGRKLALRAELLDIVADVTSAPLPPCDVLLISDACYTAELAAAMARRCAEALACSPTTRVVVADPGRPHHKAFVDALHAAGCEAHVEELGAAPTFAAWLREDEPASRVRLLHIEDDARTFGLSGMPAMC